MQKELINFYYNGIKFLIEVMYSKKPLKELVNKEAYKIKIIKPFSKEFSKIIYPPRGLSSAMAFDHYVKNKNYYFDKNLDDNSRYNLYYQAIYQVVDWYFNRYNPKLEKINQKISNFSKKLQNSYERLIIALKNQKEELKQNIISNKIYQQKVVPINRKIRDYRHNIYWLLDRFKTRFLAAVN